MLVSPRAMRPPRAKIIASASSGVFGSTPSIGPMKVEGLMAGGEQALCDKFDRPRFAIFWPSIKAA